jgi:Tfp pilus assembly protein PilW
MTMVELLVGLGIFAVVTLTLTLVLFSTTRLGSRTSQRAGVQGTVRQAMSLMTTELRQAGADPSIPPAGILGIVAADSQTVRIRADHSGDGILQTTEPSEDVTYSYTQGTGALTRDPGTGAVTVASNITSLLFRYFDAANTPLTTLPLSAADAALVKTIRVTLTAEDGESRPITLDTRITLRNR